MCVVELSLWLGCTIVGRAEFPHWPFGVSQMHWCEQFLLHSGGIYRQFCRLSTSVARFTDFSDPFSTFIFTLGQMWGLLGRNYRLSVDKQHLSWHLLSSRSGRGAEQQFVTHMKANALRVADKGCLFALQPWTFPHITRRSCMCEWKMFQSDIIQTDQLPVMSDWINVETDKGLKPISTSLLC